MDAAPAAPAAPPRGPGARRTLLPTHGATGRSAGAPPPPVRPSRRSALGSRCAPGVGAGDRGRRHSRDAPGRNRDRGDRRARAIPSQWSERRAPLFSVFVPNVALPFRYRLRLHFGDAVWERDDPYRFLPTIGEVDSHLFSEGTHRRLWEKLGAHVRTIDGSQGVAFAVWAPNARAGERDRRFLRLGRPRLSHAEHGLLRGCGSCSSRASAMARSTSTRSSRGTARRA